MSLVTDFTVDPTAVIRLIQGNLADRYQPEAIVKELIQNADDAKASRVVIGFTPEGLPSARHPLLKGPAVFVWNDGRLTEADAANLRRFGSNAKYGEKTTIGKFGLGLKSVFHLCEAFFFLSSEAERAGYTDGRYAGLLNPWCQTGRHPEWNADPRPDLAGVRAAIGPRGSDWFALWLPLRTADQAAGSCIHRKVSDLPAVERLFSLEALAALSPSLPLLKSVRHVLPAGIEAGETRLADGAARSRFSEWADSPPAEPLRSGGTGQIVGPDGSRHYALAECWVPDLLALRADPGWPESPNESGAMDKDKAMPHAAVVLTWNYHPNAAGLDVREAVFLPLTAPAASRPRFTLLAHGCFFLDSGRKGVHDGGDGVRETWNTRLRDEGVHPCVLPAVERLVAESHMPADAAEELTRELMNSERFKTGRSAICRDGGWLLRWDWEQRQVGWQFVRGAELLVLNIPDPGDDTSVVGRALPCSTGLGEGVVVTFAGRPRLTAKETIDWPDRQLAEVLRQCDFSRLLSDAPAREYLRRFLITTQPRGEAVEALAGRLGRLAAADVRSHEAYVRGVLTDLIGEARQAALRATAHLPVWPAVTVSGGLPRGEVFLSANELSHSRVHRNAPGCLASDLTRAVDGLCVHLVDHAVADLVRPQMTRCDESAAAGVLAADPRPTLAPPEERLGLLGRLLGRAPRTVVRYLLHGDPAVGDGEELFVPDDLPPGLRPLADAAVPLLAHRSRVLHHRALTALLSGQHRAALGVHALNADGLASLLEEVGPERLAVRFEPDHRDKVLVALRDHPQVVQRLPLHDAADRSGMRAIGEGCFWADDAAPFPVPASMGRLVALMHLTQNGSARAVQLNAHPHRWDRLAAIEVALGPNANPSEHWEAILAAVVDGVQRSQQLTTDVIDRLRSVPFLPRRVRTPVPPDQILFAPALESALTAVRSRLADPRAVTLVDDLRADVRGHEGFRHLMQRCLSGAELVRRLAQVLASQDAFQIGPPHPSEGEFDAWVTAFEHCGDMPAAALLGEITQAIGTLSGVKQAVHTHLLPTLSARPLPVERLVGALRHLRERHRTHPARAVPLYCRYLRQLAALDETTFRSALSEIELLNQLGEWCGPGQICIADGVNPSHQLNEEMQTALDGRAVSQRPRAVGARPLNQHELKARPDAVWIQSATVLRDYFSPWASDEQTSEAVGAFLAVLGDLPQLADEATRLLGGRMTREEVWHRAGLTDPPPEGHRRPSRAHMMARQRFLIEVTEHTARLSVLNLLGEWVEVTAAGTLDSLLFGYRLHREEILLEGDVRMHWLNLLRVNPIGLPLADRRRLLTETARLIFTRVYGQPAADLGPVLAHLAGDNCADVEQVQAEVLIAAGEYLRRFGVTDVPQLREAFDRYRRWRERRAAENRHQGELLDGTPSAELERAACEHLRALVEERDDVRAALLDGVRRHLADFRYRPDGTLFELFQNADDAYVQLPADGGRPEFRVSTSGSRVTISHTGRRINQVVRGEEADRHRRDLSNMVFFNHSDKPASGGALTGRFGLGFKSAYLVCDRPRVVSGRITFEVVAGVYPRPLAVDDARRLRDGQTESATVVELDIREGVELREVVGRFRRLAHLLVVFARRTRTVRFSSSGDAVTWAEEEIVSGTWGRFVRGGLYPDGGGAPRQAVVLRASDADGASAGDVLFGLDGGGFVPVPADVPSVWVTAPTGECHDLGVVVNAPGAQLDMGRELVQWDGEDSTRSMGRLGTSLGDGLIALFDRLSADPSRLPGAADRERFWAGLARVVSRTRRGPAPLTDLFWHHEHGAVTRLYRERPSRPTGFADADGPYRALVRTGDIRYVLGGRLCGQPDERAATTSWPEFREVYPPGTLALQDHAQGVPTVDLATFFGTWHGHHPTVTPEQAARFGQVVTRASFPRYAGGESDRLRVSLRLAEFRAWDGSWRAAGELLVAASPQGVEIEADEPRRAAFAPPERVLHPDYTATAVEFFVVCRDQMRATLEDMTRWALAADTDARREAVLRYLCPDEGGQYSGQLARHLRDDRTPTKWFSPLSEELAARAGLDAHQLYRLELSLGIRTPPPPQSGGTGRDEQDESGDDTDDDDPSPDDSDATSQQRHAPGTALARIAAWWQRDGARRLSAYERDVYPNGQRPSLGTLETPNRREWLKLLVLGTLQTIGRVNPEQHRGFLQHCEQSGWLDRLLTGEKGGHLWLDGVNAYIDGRVNDLPWGHWLQKFVAVTTIARHLDDYIQAFRDINGLGGRFAPHRTLVTREGPDYAGTSVSAPPLTPMLSIGTCFILRELVRLGQVSRPQRDVDPFCYPPVGRLRRFLPKIGGPKLEGGSTVMDRSRSIHDFLTTHLGPRPFGEAFDIPLLALAENDALCRQVLGPADHPGDRP